MEREANQERREQKSRQREKQRQKNPQQNHENDNPFADIFTNLINNEAAARAQGFLQGLHAVANSEYVRSEKPYPILWERGAARLIDYAPDATNSLAILLIPSLINRYYVLDLTPTSSFMLHLKASGFRPIVMDWGAPSEEEIGFNTADYVSAMALDAANHVREQHDGPLALLGYCMGGVFAVAMAQLAPRLFDALILLATPWDFAAEDSPRIAINDAAGAMLRGWLMGMNPVPQHIINTLFHIIDPWAIQHRYSKFPELSDEQQKHFLALEHWLNDGTPIAQAVACEAFVDWPLANSLHEGKWKVGRTWIEPEAIRIPTLCVIPEHDRIVSQGCALPLAQRISKCDTLTPSLGHVSMVVSPRAKDAVWIPITQWLKRKF